MIGLLGGVASGKSAAAAKFAKLGANVLDADTAAHEAINRPEVKLLLKERWGPQVLDNSGNIDRGAVARKVFVEDDMATEELRFLENLLHPIIRDDFERQLARLAQTNCPAAVIDAPLLLEAGWQDLCDQLLFIESAQENRCKRAKSRNWTPEDLARREAAQMPIDKKREAATHILYNQGALLDLEEEVAIFWHQLQNSEHT